MRHCYNILCFAIAATVQSPTVRADAPLAPPARQELCSPSGSYCVVLNPGSSAQAFHVFPDGRREFVWSVPGWHRYPLVLDDGEHFISDCQSLLVPDSPSVDPEYVLLTVYYRGNVTTQVRLREVLANIHSLQPTSSHVTWGRCAGVTPMGELILKTVEKRMLFLNINTGELVWR